MPVRCIIDAEGDEMSEAEKDRVAEELDPNGMERTSLSLVRWQKRALEKMGVKEGRSLNDLVRQAVGEFLRSNVDVKWSESVEQPDEKGD